jgi:hypothetical protein
MDLNEILSNSRKEHDRLSRAIAVLEGTAIHGRRVARMSNGRRMKRRRLSTAARRRISEAAKAGWAKVKKAGGNRL